MGILKKILIFSSAISLVLSQDAIASKRLSGAGATFPSKIYTRWFFDLAKSGDQGLITRQLVRALGEKLL